MDLSMSYYACLSILQSMIDMVTIPILDREDTMLWNHSHDGHLSFNDAYDFHGDYLDQNTSWAKHIWHIAIPLDKPFIPRRSLHDKLPTNETLARRGRDLPSMCSL